MMPVLMLRTMQLLCLGLYGLGVAALGGWWSGAVPMWCWRASLAIWAVHGLELVLARRWVALHTGPYWHSVLLTLLFGALHWWPLKTRAEQAPHQDSGQA
jgi:hypothetical protein